MARKFQVEIVTPERVVYDGQAEMIVVRTIDGDEAFMADHMWTVSPLATGVLKIQEDNKVKKNLAYSGGFIHVKEDLMTVIVDSAEWPEEIDENRAKAAKKRAEQRLESKDSNIDIDRAKGALLRALNRLRVSEEYRQR